MRSYLSKGVACVVVLSVLAACKNGGEDEGSGGGADQASSSAAQGGGDGSGGDGRGGDGSGGSGGETSGSGTGGAGSGSGGSGTGAGTPGWTHVPLVDDESNPDHFVYHSGNSTVTGIHFTSLDRGIIVAAGGESTFFDGGAIFGATGTEVTSVLLGGSDENSTCLSGTIDYVGVEKTESGYVALAHACDLIRSTDDGESFGIESVGAGDPFGIEKLLAFREHGGSVTLVRSTGVVSETSDELDGGALWDDVWAPEAVPTIPDPIPEGQCTTGPRGRTVPADRSPVHVSADGSFIAYASEEGDDSAPAICISHDGGRSFFPSMLDVQGEGAGTFVPTGVLFTSATVGITWWASDLYPGEAYILRTTDGGETWANAPLPDGVADREIELRGAFFAPDGDHGWIVGHDHEHDVPLLLRTTDGGGTWDDDSGDLAVKVDEADGGRLLTGFALDADHIWVGGKYGLLMANSAGGL